MDVVFILGEFETNMTRDNRRLKQLLLSSIDQPSSADIKVALMRSGRDTTTYREFQYLEDDIDVETFTKLLATTKPDEGAVMIFNQNGRPDARRVVVFLMNQKRLPKDEEMAKWNMTFAENGVLVIPVLFGDQDVRRLRPLAPETDVHRIDPDDDPIKTGEKIAQTIMKGTFI